MTDPFELAFGAPGPKPRVLFGGAYFSADGTRRYMLERVWDLERPVVTWGMVNPSKAGALEDDPTIGRVIGFSAAAGYGGAVVVNVTALISTDPKLLRDKSLAQLRSDENSKFIGRACMFGQDFVHAWGVPMKPLAPLYREFVELVAQSYETVHSLGKTSDGWPPHPLYLPGDRRPEPWTWPA